MEKDKKPFMRPMDEYPNMQPEQMPPQAIQFRLMYPDIYYRLLPYIMMACDEMDSFATEMPTQDMIEQMSDNICDEMLAMYPDLSDYIKDMESRDTTIAVQVPLRFRRPRRRRGLFRDLIDILLLTELFRRRRRFR